MTLGRRLAAEAFGTAFLLMAVIGSGIMGERLAAGNVAVALLANGIATGCALAALIVIFVRVSGAHFNPAVSITMAMEHDITWREALFYVGTQVAAAYVGVAAAHAMFGEPVFSASLKGRTGWAQWWSEFVATFGLLMVILGCVKQRITMLPLAVAAYITAAYWFTASTSFANPAVTLGRAASDTFAGIDPRDVVPFIGAQLLGATAATMIWRWFAVQAVD